MVTIRTNMGEIKAELFTEETPETTANFLQYVADGFYDGAIFHRVIAGFMIQGGGFTPEMKEKKTRAPIVNEARADAKNKRGTLAMARTSDVNSATAQFFINLANNDFLDHKDKTPRAYGYAVFGQVVEGMDVVDAIAGVSTGSVGHFDDVPTEPVIIESISDE